MTRVGLREQIMRTHTNERPSHDQPDGTELNFEDLEKVSAAGGVLATTLSNIANMRHEELKAVAQNLRA